MKLGQYFRRRALARLYARRDAVDNLIRALQNYADTSEARRVDCIPLSVERKCSSDFAQ
jgi:hypothetical protein